MNRQPRWGRRVRSVICAVVLLGAAAATELDAQMPATTPGDAWVEEPVVYPQGWMLATTNGFDSLRSEGVAGKLKVSWNDPGLPTNATVRVWHSLGEPGHWQARAWRSSPATRRIATWDVTVPVPHPDLPMVYFLEVNRPGQSTNVSPLRVCHPREAGLEEITRPFWPFLEGFEEGLDNWRWHGVAPAGTVLGLHTNAYNGYASLRVPVPAGRRTVTVATTVVQGWHLELFNARGLGLWVRTLGGEAALRWTFITDYGTTNQMVFPAGTAQTVGNRWEKLETLFDVIPEQHRGQLDLVAVEVESRGAAEVLLDNLHLLGRWRLDLE